MLKRLLLALGGTLVVLTGAARAEVDPNYSVVLLTENFPPYNMAINGKNFAQEDNIDGIAVDIVKEMFKRAGVKYNLTLRFPWDRIYKLALEKPGYGVFVTARLPEREQLFKWVGPIGPDDWVLLAKGDNPINLASLDEAKQYRVGAYKGDAISEYLTEKGVEHSASLRDQENARKLVAGQIDLWATGDPAGRYLAKQEGISGLRTVLRFDSAELYLALNRDVPDEIVARLQAALDQMRSEGFVDDILNSYFGTSYAEYSKEKPVCRPVSRHRLRPRAAAGGLQGGAADREFPALQHGGGRQELRPRRRHRRHQRRHRARDVQACRHRLHPDPALSLGSPVPPDPGQAQLRPVLHHLHARASAAVQVGRPAGQDRLGAARGAGQRHQGVEPAGRCPVPHWRLQERCGQPASGKPGPAA
ncbi:unnamed protein product, partial [Wuchereria bancrofti]